MRTGTVIESYEILEKLGTGEVYRARHTVTGHYTAIKRLIPAGAGDLDRHGRAADALIKALGGISGICVGQMASFLLRLKPVPSDHSI